jgi:hypothetical protein
MPLGTTALFGGIGELFYERSRNFLGILNPAMFFGMASLATARIGALKEISVLPSRSIMGRIVHVHGAAVARISLGLVRGLCRFFYLKLVHLFNMHASKKIVQIRRIVRFQDQVWSSS